MAWRPWSRPRAPAPPATGRPGTGLLWLISSAHLERIGRPERVEVAAAVVEIVRRIPLEVGDRDPDRHLGIRPITRRPRPGGQVIVPDQEQRRVRARRDRLRI